MSWQRPLSSLCLWLGLAARLSADPAAEARRISEEILTAENAIRELVAKESLDGAEIDQLGTLRRKRWTLRNDLWKLFHTAHGTSTMKAAHEIILPYETSRNRRTTSAGKTVVTASSYASTFTEELWDGEKTYVTCEVSIENNAARFSIRLIPVADAWTEPLKIIDSEETPAWMSLGRFLALTDDQKNQFLDLGERTRASEQKIRDALQSYKKKGYENEKAAKHFVAAVLDAQIAADEIAPSHIHFSVLTKPQREMLRRLGESIYGKGGAISKNSRPAPGIIGLLGKEVVSITYTVGGVTKTDFLNNLKMTLKNKANLDLSWEPFLESNWEEITFETTTENGWKIILEEAAKQLGARLSEISSSHYKLTK